MTNEQRLKLINEMYGNKYGITDKNCIKILGQGWIIRLVKGNTIHDFIAKNFNKGSYDIRGKYPNGLLEAKATLHRYLKQYETIKSVEVTSKPASK